MASIEAKQKIEIEFWRDAVNECAGSNSVHTLVNKASAAQVFIECVSRHANSIHGSHHILELGGGQGWASCVSKRLFPAVHMTATDISDFAIQSLPKWEKAFYTSVDNSYACTSYQTAEKDASIDFIFSFAAAHHFLAHKRTLGEISRILKPEGKAMYFYEPTSPRFLYSLAYWRVNRKRPEVPEDVLIPSELAKLAQLYGLDLLIDYYPSPRNRAPMETIYYFMLSKLPILQRILPSTAIFVFTKKS